mgnify:CR=1 FL=1
MAEASSASESELGSWMTEFEDHLDPEHYKQVYDTTKPGVMEHGGRVNKCLKILFYFSLSLVSFFKRRELCLIFQWKRWKRL